MQTSKEHKRPSPGTRENPAPCKRRSTWTEKSSEPKKTARHGGSNLARVRSPNNWRSESIKGRKRRGWNGVKILNYYRQDGNWRWGGTQIRVGKVINPGLKKNRFLLPGFFVFKSILKKPGFFWVFSNSSEKSWQKLRNLKKRWKWWRFLSNMFMGRNGPRLLKLIKGSGWPVFHYNMVI